MTFFINKYGKIKQEQENKPKQYWLARFDTTYLGQRQSKYHYCDDYDTLRYFVENAVKSYNDESLVEDLTPTDLDKELIMEIIADNWISEDIQITITPIDGKPEDLKVGLLHKIWKR